MKIINLGILAHVDAGKTTLTESLLYTSGAIAELGSVDKGTTRTDTMNLERQRGITIQTAVTSFQWEDVKVNIIDTPGHMDFLAEVYRSLSVLDGAVLLVSAKDGIQAQTRILFHALQTMKIPTIFFINKIDQEGIDLPMVYREMKAKLSSEIIVKQKVGQHPHINVTDNDDMEQWDAVIMGNDELLEKYMSGKPFKMSELEQEENRRFQNGTLFPVYHGSAKNNLGIRQLIEVIASKFYSSTPEGQSELCGQVFKIEYSEKRRRFVYVRIYSGREIFDLALAGNGIAKIRKHINKQHILRPAAYAVEQGSTGYERHFEGNEENRYIWSENSVRGILRSPIYAGNLAGYKRIAANMKSKKRPSKLPEEWEVIPDTHEGIVTQEEFDNVQQLITSRRLPENKGGFENIFAGVIKCADCGYAMRAMSANRRKRPDIIDCVQYTCNNYGRYGNIMCTAHSIEARDLFNAVLIDINRFADMAVSDEKAVRAIEKRLTETDQSKAKALEKEQRKLNKRLAELDRLFSSLYEDKVMERITERNFEMMSGKYQKEQLEIEARLKEVMETLNDSYEKSQGVRDFLSLIRNYQGIKELDATIINALIDKILVSEREKLTDGTVRQEIKIYYKFIGFVGELHITPTKRWTALKPKNCTVCGVEYVPCSAISKYCPECRKKIRKVRGTETKRRSRERNRQACIELSAKNDRLTWNRGKDVLSVRETIIKRFISSGM